MKTPFVSLPNVPLLRIPLWERNSESGTPIGSPVPRFYRFSGFPITTFGNDGLSFCIKYAHMCIWRKCHFLTLILSILAVLASQIGCKDEIQGPDGDQIVFPDSNVSFSKHVEPLFQQRCALAGCHAGSNPAAGLELTTPAFSKLMNHQPRLVISGESNNSLLVQRIEGRISPRMPLIGSPLNDNQISGIKKWIDEGAVNN